MVNFDYLYNPDFAKEAVDKNYFVDKKLGFRIIDNGTILPTRGSEAGKPVVIGGIGGIVDSKGEFIKESHIHLGTGGAYTPTPESIQHRSETIIYLGTFFDIWGHAITDNIRRLWFLKSEFMNQFKNCPLIYLPAGRYTPEKCKDFKRLLEILEFDIEKFQPITQPTRFDRIILPDESFYGEKLGATIFRRFTNEYREMMERVRHFALKNRTPTSRKKLYFFYGQRGQVGEERLAEYFKSKGYEIIPHEQRADFDDEINLLINAESFAAPLGSCSHNSVFLRDGTEAIFIPRIGIDAINSYQLALNQVNSINATYVDSTFSLFLRTPCFIVSEQLKRLFNDKFCGYEDGDFKSFLTQTKNSLNEGRTFLPGQIKTYGIFFSNFMAQLKQRKDLIDAFNMPLGWETFQASLSYQTHVHRNGWSDGWKMENKPSNPLDQKLEVLAIKVNYPGHKIYYQVYFNDEEGWSPEILSPEMAGTVGIRKPIYGMRVRFDEAGAKEFNILYRMHKFDGTWTPWAKNGEAIYSHKQRLNAIQIKLEPIKSVEANSKQIDNPQALLLKDDAIYLQGQRQNLMQLKCKLT